MSRWSARGWRWSKARAEFLSANPVCAIRTFGCTTVATQVDHVVPVSKRPDLRFDPTNWRPACRACNGRKGAGQVPAVERQSRRW